MASGSGTRLTGVWFLASFVWLLCTLQRHTLFSQPRLSSFLLLLISGSLALVVSIFSKWLPGSHGRFDSDAVLKASSSLPPRPRRFYVPCVIILIVFRLELYYRVVHDFQCSTAGIEAFLPLSLTAYRFFSYRAPQVESDEPEEMWGNLMEDIVAWFTASPFMLLFGAALLSYGAFLAGSSTMRSTYFCSSLVDQGAIVVLAQLVGLLMETTIIILLWRVLSWARTTKSRLRILGDILIISSFATCIPSVMSQPSRLLDGVNPIYIFDTLSTGMIVAVLVISTSLMICDTSPLEPVTIATLVYSIFSGVGNLLLVGTYQQTSAAQPLAMLGTTSLGFIIFIYANNMRSVIFIRRVLLLLLLLSILISSAIYTSITPKVFTRHPVDDLVYKNRIEADRWLRHATVSTTLKLAVKEYEERHHGRKPPRNFEKWFEFARQRKSVVIDKFDQIEKDVSPFWGLQPQKIRDGLDFLKSQSNIGIISIANGKVSHNNPADPSQQRTLDGIITLISSFAEHLPAMDIAINMQERPRVLVPWNSIKSDTSTGRGIRTNKQMSPAHQTQSPIAAHRFQHLEALACPPGSPSRSGENWDVRDFCASCTSPHSKEQFLDDWQMALDPCHQPDLFHLHEFYTTPHRFDLYQELIPLFSGSKTAGFSDLLIPLPRSEPDEYYDSRTFDQKQDLVLWQGDAKDVPMVTHELLHGSHRLRLVHLVQNAKATDKIPMLLGIGAGKNSRFRYEHVPVTEGNSILPLQITLTGPPEGCKDVNCEFLRREFGLKLLNTEVEGRYVMLLDTSDGPPPDLLPVLRSNSVPVLSSIFHQWFTERLMPWVHFIPIDTRYHALHSTMSYFIGLDGRGTLNGRKQITPGRTEDARWIAQQGRKWAEKAIRREDMEVYLFRLLLEWGRVIDDDRDNMNFILKG
ncbi:hypothetical protein F5B22DRAFT_638916 [Xylaria bambusicola]|uniref:uncharacterized protein n=1 Tax=Xylaria bambusicola TaxID=326684 RepID=UPI0020077358|nr:uncharacterized protein F5B22DRAFT_638916 [Xylaria bambusicola]KAI0506950.1 hypothetical protein F5B22DRAFT_638916 [Xylaria bambusicola]